VEGFNELRFDGAEQMDPRIRKDDDYAEEIRG